MQFDMKKTDEIDLLKQLDILEEEDSNSLVYEDFYQCSEWAEVFWRRRNIHARRFDPELSFIEKLKPTKVLEVGSAYGRFTRKILALQQKNKSDFSSLEVTGLEINPNFQNYISLYSKKYPQLSKVNFIYSDIFKVKEVLSSGLFDVIIIPMHTVPNFPFETPDNLFENLSYVLRKDGHCIFSVHNQKFDENSFKLQKHKLTGELLLEKKKQPIAIIVYYFPIRKTNYGYSITYYIIPHFLNKRMCSEKKIICRLVKEYITPAKWKEIISRNGFALDFIDNETFSKVYSIIKK